MDIKETLTAAACDRRETHAARTSSARGERVGERTYLAVDDALALGDDAPAQLAVDSPTGNVTIRGLASRTGIAFTQWDLFGPYQTIVAPGAFKQTLAADPQVVMLINHGGLPLASTRNGALDLWESERGLEYEAHLPLADPDVYALAVKIDRRAVTENSMMFMVVDQEWNEEMDTRTINEVDLDRGDVGPVLYGANPHTPLFIKAAAADVAESDASERDADELAEAAAARRSDADERMNTDATTIHLAADAAATSNAVSLARARLRLERLRVGA